MRLPLIGSVVVAALIALPLHAQTISARVIRFDPANPTDATPVTIHVSGPNQSSCFLETADAAVNGSTITVTLHASQCSLTPPSPDAWFHVAVPVAPLHAGRYDIQVNVDGLPNTISIGSSTLAVRDAAPPFEVIPNFVSSSGGDYIQLAGNNINPACRICPKTLIHLGDATVEMATDEISTFNSIPVKVPPHAPGIVDVSIERDGVIVYRSDSALDYTDFGAGDPEFFEKELVSVILNSPGAFGSQWRTDLALYNASDYAIPSPLPSSCDPISCFPIQSRNLFQVSGANAPQGVMLPLPRQAARRVTIGLLARDLSKQAEALGTELPVVREADLRDGAFSLLSVPADPRFRVALRLYGIDDVRGVTMRIRPMNNAANDIVDAIIKLSPSTDPGGAATFGYVGDLLTQYPQAGGNGPLHIEIDANGARVWGFISVTNNETQHVTVISPQ